MFSKKVKQPRQAPKPSAEETVLPCEDEPEEWSRYSEEEHARAWYRLEFLTDGSFVPDGSSDSLPSFSQYFDDAAQGNRCAQYALGKMYLTGTLVQRNPFQAGLRFSQASDAGSPFAAYELAKMYESGIGVKRNEESAGKLYRKALKDFTAIERKSPNPAVEKKIGVLKEKGFAEESGPEIIPKHVRAEGSKESTGDEEKEPEWSRSEKVPAKYIFPSEYNPYAENDTEECLGALAESIRANGLIHPLAVNRISENEYRLISGERRFNAITQYLHWKMIPCMVYDHITENSAKLKLHAANLEVRDYTAEQKLRFYKETSKLLHGMKESGEYTGPIQKGIAELLGISTHQVRKYKRIFESLSSEQLNKVRDGSLSIEKAFRMTRQTGRASYSPDEADVPESGRASHSPEEADVPKSGRTSYSSKEADVPESGRTSYSSDSFSFLLTIKYYHN